MKYKKNMTQEDYTYIYKESLEEQLNFIAEDMLQEMAYNEELSDECYNKIMSWRYILMKVSKEINK